MRTPPPYQDYLEAITTNPDLDTSFLLMDGAGVGVTLEETGGSAGSISILTSGLLVSRPGLPSFALRGCCATGAAPTGSRLLLLLRILEQRLDGAVELLLAGEPEELVPDDALVVEDVERRPALDVP